MRTDPRLTPARRDLAAAHLHGQVEAARFVEGEQRIVTAEVADLRRAPSPDSPLETQALYGEAVSVYEEHEGWCWAQLASDGYVGYLAAANLAPPGPEPTHRVSVPRTFLYDAASIKTAAPRSLPRGASVTVTATVGDFATVAGGGHLWARHLARLGTHDRDYVAVAETYLDTAYLWGGKTSLGIDCSALVQVSLAAAGIAAPRDSDMQEAALGQPLPVTESLAGLRRGDLVFWKGHVGILRDAETLLHASGHHMLVTSEPLHAARERIRSSSFGEITAVRRLE